MLSTAIPRVFTGWLLCLGSLLSMLYLWSTRAPRRWRENRLSKMDWVWYIALPYCAYAFTLAAGIDVLRDGHYALPGIAATMVFLLVIGIRNAWDLAVWMPMQEKHPEQRQSTGGEGAA